jgi:hypothetical protein
MATRKIAKSKVAKKDTPRQTPEVLEAIADRLTTVSMDLSALRGLCGIILNDSPDVHRAAELASAIDAIVVRAGRVVQQCAAALGDEAYCDWPDYAQHAEEEVAHG